MCPVGVLQYCRHPKATLDVLLQLPRQLISFKFSDARRSIFTHCLAVKVRAADLKSVTSTMEASKLLVCILKSARLPNLMLALNGKIVTRNSWLLGCNSAPSFLLLPGSLLLLVYLGRKESLGISCSQSKTSTVRYSPWCRSSHGI